MFRIAICDNEIIFAEELKRLISAYLSEKRIVFEVDIFKSGAELVTLGVELARYTAVFIDINANGIDGIEAARKIRAINREVFLVFVTEYMSYALEGYRLDVVRYLLKGDLNFPAKIGRAHV